MGNGKIKIGDMVTTTWRYDILGIIVSYKDPYYEVIWTHWNSNFRQQNGGYFEESLVRYGDETKDR
jgi:hypothetical protein